MVAGLLPVGPGGASVLGCAPVLAAFIWAYRANPAEIKKLLAQHKSGSGLSVGDPLFALRRFLLESERRDSKTPDVVFRKTLAALRATLEGRQLTKLQDSINAVEGITALWQTRPEDD